MKSFPHLYRTLAAGRAEGGVSLNAPGLPELPVAPPAEFDGPGDQWSPETLMSGTIASCYVLTFRAVARASRLEWIDLVCEVEATLDRVGRETRFTHVLLRPILTVPPHVDPERAGRILEKSEQNCLVTSSLRAEVRVEPQVLTATPA